jgi:hypothetical protein
MASSGTTTYSATELDIYTDVLESLGVIGLGVTPYPEHVVVLRRKLQMLLKQWVAQADFAPGLKMWTRRRGFLFFAPDTHVYTIGTGGDKCADEDYTTTTTTVAAAGGAGSLTVTSTTGIAAADVIGVLMDSGALHWTTVSGAPSGSVVTLTVALTGAAAAGARVFAYTTAVRNPFDIESASIRYESGEDAPIDPHMSSAEYELIQVKSTAGTPSGLYFEAGKTAAKVYLNREPDDRATLLRFVYTSYIEDASALATSIDIPPEWTRAVSAQLVIDAADNFRATVTPSQIKVRDEALAMARNAHPLKSPAFYECDPDDY